MPEAAREISQEVGLSDTAWGRGLRIFGGVVLAAGLLAMAPGLLDTTGPIKRLVFAVGTFGLALGVLAGLWRTGRRAGQPSVLTALAAFVLGWMALAAMASGYTGLGMAAVAKLAVGVAWMAAVGQIVSRPRHIGPFGAGLCGAMLAAAFYGFAQRIGADPFPWAYERNALYALLPSTFGNPNYAAHTLTLCILLALYLGLGTHRPFWLLVLPVFLIHLVLTHQRGGPAALVAAAAFVGLAWAVSRRRAAPSQGSTFVFCGMAAFALAVVLGVGVAAYAWTGLAAPIDGSLIKRYNSYASAARMAADRPLMGHGPGAYAVVNVPYWTDFEKDQFAQGHELNQHVHFDALQLATEAGLPAAFGYVCLLTLAVGMGAVLALGGNADQRRFGLFTGAFAVAFGVDGLFGFNLRVPVSMMAGFTALGALDGLWSKARRAAPAKRIAWVLPAVGGAVALGALALSVWEFRAERALDAGKRLAGLLRRDEAQGRFAQAAELTPWDARGPLERGVLLSGKPAEAAQAYREALRRNPHSFMALLNRVQALLELAQEDPPSRGALVEEAQGHVDHALELCPGLPEAHHAAARVALARAKNADTSQADLAVAEKHFLDALRLGYAGRAEVWRDVAVVRRRLGDEGGERSALEQALRIDPGNAALWAARWDIVERAWDQGKRMRRLDALKDLVMEHWGREYNKVPQPKKTLAVLCNVRGDLQRRLPHDGRRAHELYAWAIALDPVNLEAWRSWTDKAAGYRIEVPLGAVAEKLETAQGRIDTPVELQALYLALSGDAQARLDASAWLREEAFARLPEDAEGLEWAARWALKGVADAGEEGETVANLALVLRRCAREALAEGYFFALLAKGNPGFAAWEEPDRIAELLRVDGTAGENSAAGEFLGLLEERNTP